MRDRGLRFVQFDLAAWKGILFIKGLVELNDALRRVQATYSDNDHLSWFRALFQATFGYSCHIAGDTKGWRQYF